MERPELARGVQCLGRHFPGVGLTILSSPADGWCAGERRKALPHLFARDTPSYPDLAMPGNRPLLGCRQAITGARRCAHPMGCASRLGASRRAVWGALRPPDGARQPPGGEPACGVLCPMNTARRDSRIATEWPAPGRGAGRPVRVQSSSSTTSTVPSSTWAPLAHPTDSTWPSPGAARVCSIFIASSTTSG